MTHPSRLHELLDCCRLDRGDESAPEMQELTAALRDDPQVRAARERSLEFDRQVTTALTAVPVPPQLAGRLLAHCLAAANAAPAVGPVAPPTPPPPVVTSTVAAPPAVTPHPAAATSNSPEPNSAIRSGPPHSARRHWLGWAVALSLGVACVGWWVWPRSRVPESAEQLTLSAVQWSDQVQVEAHWLEAFDSAPADRPASSQVRGSWRGWRAFATGYDRHGAAYALQGPRGEAWLFVLGTRAPFLRPEERPQRLASTGGTSVAAWTEGPLLYVLVCRERGQRLEDYLVPRRLAVRQRGIHVPRSETPKTRDNGYAA